MKVAIFGCLHGMLDDMYRAIEQHESQTNQSIDLVIVCGDCQTIRHYDDLRCLSVPNKYKRIGDFHQYYSNQKRIPKLTIFVGGNHEASNYLMTLPYGGWVCDNFYYLGYAGVIKYKGLRIAGVSGIYNFRNCNRGRFEKMPLDDQSMRSIYHTRRLDVFRLQLLSKNAQEHDPIDIFLSHDWPARVYDYGNLKQLLKYKPAFRGDVNSRDGLGSPMTQPLIHQLKPRRWFAAHLHCKFYAKVEHDGPSRRCTEFLSLSKVQPGQRYSEFIDLSPNMRRYIQQQESIDKQSKATGGDSDRQGRSNDVDDDNREDIEDEDNDLYYDEEWLTVLRKTVCLEALSRNNVPCPRFGDPASEAYVPSDEDIKETTDMMVKTGGLKIKRNFSMTEPVIYNRPGNAAPSIDSSRAQYFANPQHEELCSRLNIRSRMHRSDSAEVRFVS